MIAPVLGLIHAGLGGPGNAIRRHLKIPLAQVGTLDRETELPSRKSIRLGRDTNVSSS
jgi:hypothetical protein